MTILAIDRPKTKCDLWPRRADQTHQLFRLRILAKLLLGDQPGQVRVSAMQCSTSRDHVVEYAWSEWSKCSVTCGLGVQTRHVSCSDSGSWLSFCLETNQGKSESRPCNAIPCSTSNQLSNLTGSGDKDLCECLNGGTCHLKRRTCHCPAGFGGRHCEIRECPGPCLHGGICHNSGHCSCPPEYTGETCQTPVCRPPCMNGGQCVKPGVCSCPSNSNHPRCASFVL
ncbi:hypothetical protein J6590_079018 [Homalodisca vitripennis]|nr:hypothetical protein J6590_079018 [Homalodisca vitripennis]